MTAQLSMILIALPSNLELPVAWLTQHGLALVQHPAAQARIPVSARYAADQLLVQAQLLPALIHPVA